MLFQKNILRKYLALLPAEQIAEAWSTFQSYFLNGDISNFEKLRLYIDNTVEHIEWNLFTLTEQEFREMYLCLAFEQVKQETALKMKQESVSSEDQITKALYKDYSAFKRVLFADIVKNNPSGTQASRLRESSLPSAEGDGETPAYQRESSLPTDAGDGTQASRLRDNSQPSAAGETPAYQSELRKLLIVLDKYEDAGYGQCFLRDERIAQIVQNALLHFHEERYELVQWCIMPNHVHVLVKTMPDISISDIMHSWRSFTAHEANMVLGRTGQFWMEEYFDRYIRDAEHFDSTVRYIRNNPVKAGLVSEPEQWPWAGDGTQASRLREINLSSAAGVWYAGVPPAE